MALAGKSGKDKSTKESSSEIKEKETACDTLKTEFKTEYSRMVD